MDLDQEMMEEQLALATDDSFAAALRLYSEGAFSKSVAKVTLSSAIGDSIEKGTMIEGENADGEQVIGKAYADYASGATEIMIQYQTSDNQATYVECQVGASVSPNTKGCFASSGTVSIADVGDLSYSYDPDTDNINKRTIQGFSTGAQSKMAECANCPYPMYQKFYEYYGDYAYADQLVLDAFSGSQTNFKNFNNDFGLYSFDGKEQIIKKATSYMHIWMYVIREMEDAIDDCKEECDMDNCNDDPVHAWDEAVAFYTGSLEGTDGSGSGKLPYALADKRCVNFKTCGEMGDTSTGGSNVNMEIFKEFSVGLNQLLKGECTDLRSTKDAIETMMLIPLIQGTLRYAYKTEKEPYSEKAEAEGVIFAASVLPAINACDSKAAETIASNMVAGQMNTADFGAVKSAFESTYECLGIDPAAVGGLYDSATGSYMEGAEPMGMEGGSDSASDSDSGAEAVSSFGITIYSVVVALASLFMLV
jgi:hypothetical protein